MEKLVYMKQRNTKTFQNILNLQNINGNTFLMILLENENYELSFDKFNDYIQFIYIIILVIPFYIFNS